MEEIPGYGPLCSEVAAKASQTNMTATLSKDETTQQKDATTVPKASQTDLKNNDVP